MRMTEAKGLTDQSKNGFRQDSDDSNEIGIPRSLSEIGVPRDCAERIAKKALQTALLLTHVRLMSIKFVV